MAFGMERFWHGVGVCRERERVKERLREMVLCEERERDEGLRKRGLERDERLRESGFV